MTRWLNRSRILSREAIAIADAMTAFTPPEHMPFKEQPGTGFRELFGLKASATEVAGSGWMDINRTDKSEYFDRYSTSRSADGERPHFYAKTGRLSPLGAVKMLQPVRPTTAQVLYRDEKGRPVVTVNQYGKGHAIWTGTLLGLGCRPANTPAARYRAVADELVIDKNPWRLNAPAGTIICRRLEWGAG